MPVMLKGFKPGHSTAISACLPIISAIINALFWRKDDNFHDFRQKND
jgi:hypothetical protein